MAATNPLSGHPGHLDQHQTSSLEAFREELSSSNLIPADREAVTQRLGYDRFDDQTLLRFLRARKFDLAKSKLMWEENEKWRKEFGADEIAANGYPYPEAPEVNKYYPQFYHRIDRDGRPIYIERLGAIDVNKIATITSQDRQLHHLVDEYEKFLKDRLPACSETKGELVETSCTILDLHNVGIGQFYRVKDYISAASAIGQNHFYTDPRFRPQPETMGHMFIINAPYLFSTVWSLIKGWLDPATVRKIHILGKNFATELEQYIDMENLPKEVGGRCARCKDGCMNSNAGPWNTGADVGAAGAGAGATGATGPGHVDGTTPADPTAPGPPAGPTHK